MHKICFFINNMGLSGGTERITSIIVNNLCKRGFEVHVVNLIRNDKPFFPLDPNTIYTSIDNVKGGGVGSFFNSVRKLRQYLTENSIDTIVDVESMLAFYAVPAVLFLGVKNIVWEHFNYTVDLGRRSRRWARHLAAIMADDVVTLTERDRGFWRKALWCRANVTAISNPVSFDVSSKKPNFDSKIFLSVGRLTDQKGFDLLLDAWAMVAKRYPDWTLEIVGDGERRASLEAQICKLSLSTSVRLLPATPDIQQHYMNASIYVMSSRFEGFPMVLLEATCFGLPIVSFDCNTGPREIIEPGVTGWLAKAEDVRSLSETMINAIEVLRNPEVYSEMSTNVLARARTFGISTFVDKWVKLLSCKK
ncbi:MAG: glycosyltransferase family 4 protein [Pseudomonadota bacterium]